MMGFTGEEYVIGYIGADLNKYKFQQAIQGNITYPHVHNLYTKELYGL
jgi:hypothetical protein